MSDAPPIETLDDAGQAASLSGSYLVPVQAPGGPMQSMTLAELSAELDLIDDTVWEDGVDKYISGGFVAGSPTQAAFTEGFTTLGAQYGGGKLRAAPRTYTINGAIISPAAAVILEGQGKYSTRILSSLGNHDLLVFPAAGQGAGVHDLELGCAPGVRPTSGYLVQLNQVGHTDLRDLTGNNYCNGFHEGGGNNSNMRDIAMEGATGQTDGYYFSTTCNTSTSSSAITVANPAGIEVGHYVYGYNAWNAETPWVPLQPNTPYASAIQVIAISGNQVTLGLNGVAINPVASLTGTDVEFSINGSIYGSSFWWDDSAAGGSTSIAHWQNLTVFAEAQPVLSVIAGHCAHRFTAVSSPFTQLLSSTRCEVGILIEDTGPLAPSSVNTNSGLGILSNYVWLLDPTAEHNGNAIVIKSGLRIKIKGGSCDGMYGDCVIGGADANYNPSSLPSAQGDISVIGYAATVSGGHGFNLFGGNWLIDDATIAGDGNPPGLPSNNNEKDGIHVNTGMSIANNGKLTVTNSSIGGANQANQRNLNPELQTVQGFCSAAGDAYTVYLPHIFRTGPGALAGLTLTVIQGAGVGQKILLATSSFQLLTTTEATTGTCVKNSMTVTLPSVAGINLGDNISAAFIYPGDSVQAIDPVANTITTNYLTTAAATGGAISFGSGRIVATSATLIATPLDTTSGVQTQYLSQRSAIYLEGDTTVTYDAIVLNNDMRGNISGTIMAPFGATITQGQVCKNLGIDDVVQPVLVTSGALGLALNSTQQISTGSPMITDIVKDKNAAHRPVIQIPGTQIKLLPSGPSATISATPGTHIANPFNGAPGQPVTLTFDGAKYWFEGSQGTA